MSRPASQGALLAVLFFGVLMGALDIAIVAPALHPIQGQFGISTRLTSWIFAIYLLFSLIGTPILAKLADLHGRRLLYVTAIVLFAAGSILVVLGGLTGQFWLFLAGRAVQGLGAGGIFPVASAVIGDTVAPDKRGAALGMIGAVWGLAFILGPILGGLLIPFGWTTLFLINLPVAAVLIAASLVVLPPHRTGNSPPLDLPAVLLLAATLGAFAFGANQLDTSHLLESLATLSVWPFFALSLVLLAVLIAGERRKIANPLFPHVLFQNPQLRLVYLIGAAYGVAQASVSYLPALAMAAFGASGVTSSQSSYLMLPLVVAMSIGSPLVGRLLDQTGSKPVLIAGTLFATAGFVLLGMGSATIGVYVAGEIVLGLGIAALAGAPLRYVVLAEASAQDRAVAQGLSSLFISMGSVVGSALIGGAAGSGASDFQGWSLAFLLVAIPTAGAALLTLGLKGKAAERAAAERNHK